MVAGEGIIIGASLLSTFFFGASVAQTALNEEERRKRDEEIRKQELKYRKEQEAKAEKQDKLNLIFATAGLVISVLSVGLLAKAYAGR